MSSIRFYNPGTKIDEMLRYDNPTTDDRKQNNVAYYRLHRRSRVTITLNRGKLVVKRFRTTSQAQGAYRRRISARRLRGGSYHVVLTAVSSDGTRTRATLTARRL